MLGGDRVNTATLNCWELFGAKAAAVDFRIVMLGRSQRFPDAAVEMCLVVAHQKTDFLVDFLSYYL